MRSVAFFLISSVALVSAFLLVSGCTAGDGGQLDPANYSTYTNQSYGFSIQYPKGWIVNESAPYKIAVFYPPDTNVSDPAHAYYEIRLESMGSSNGYPGLDDLYKYGIHENFAMAPLRGVECWISDPINTDLAGRPAYSMNYTWTEKGQASKGMIVYSVKSTERDTSPSNPGGYLTTYYLLEYSAGEDRYDAYLSDSLLMTAFFKRM